MSHKPAAGTEAAAATVPINCEYLPALSSLISAFPFYPGPLSASFPLGDHSKTKYLHIFLYSEKLFFLHIPTFHSENVIKFIFSCFKKHVIALKGQ